MNIKESLDKMPRSTKIVGGILIGVILIFIVYAYQTHQQSLGNQAIQAGELQNQIDAAEAQQKSGEWVQFISDDNNTYYYNPSSIKIDKMNMIIQVLLKIGFTEKGKIDFLKPHNGIDRQKYIDMDNFVYLWLFDYKRHIGRSIKITTYSKSGIILEVKEYPDIEWDDIPSDSSYGILVNKILKDYNIAEDQNVKEEPNPVGENKPSEEIIKSIIVNLFRNEFQNPQLRKWADEVWFKEFNINNDYFIKYNNEDWYCIDVDYEYGHPKIEMKYWEGRHISFVKRGNRWYGIYGWPQDRQN